MYITQGLVGDLGGDLSASLVLKVFDMLIRIRFMPDVFRGITFQSCPLSRVSMHFPFRWGFLFFRQKAEVQGPCTSVTVPAFGV